MRPADGVAAMGHSWTRVVTECAVEPALARESSHCTVMSHWPAWQSTVPQALWPMARLSELTQAMRSASARELPTPSARVQVLLL